MSVEKRGQVQEICREKNKTKKKRLYIIPEVTGSHYLNNLGAVIWNRLDVSENT